MALSNEQQVEIRHFLTRLQGKEVRVEMSSRINNGFRKSFKVKLEASADEYSFVSESGEISLFLNPQEAEAYNTDASSVTLLYGDELVTIRYARTR